MITLYFLKVKLSGHVHWNSLKRRCNGVRVLAFFPRPRDKSGKGCYQYTTT